MRPTRQQAMVRWQAMLVLGLLLGLVLSGCGPAPAPDATPTPGDDGGVPVPTAPDDGSGSQEALNIGPAFARDAALTYLATTYGAQAPAPGLDWTEKDTTPTNIVGGSSFEYRAGDWLVTVQYPIVAPDSTIYQVTVDGGTAFHWEGEVNPRGEVRELVLPRGDGGEPGQAPTAGEEDLPALVEGNTLFALDLYRVLRAQEGNLLASPYSLSAALAMTYAGARGQTAEQMARALHFDLPQAALHGSFAALAGELASRGQGAEGQDGEGFRLNVANALWLQEDFDLLRDYLALVEAAYGAPPRPVDFQGAPEEARVTINDWVADETEDRITDLIPAGVIDTLTRLVLTNAIYFNAAWALPFDDDLTREGPFTLLDGKEIAVPMMRQTEGYRYLDAEGYQAVELFYEGDELSMVIVLPDGGQFESFEGSLDAARLAEIEAGLSYQQVALSLPRFEFESQFSLSEALAALGMADAFTAAADFSGMTGARDLFISEVVHKAFVSVDEEGTEAAAATAVVMNLTSAPADEPAQMTVDRPFLFFIRDVDTGALLFLGRVLDPSQ